MHAAEECEGIPDVALNFVEDGLWAEAALLGFDEDADSEIDVHFSFVDLVEVICDLVITPYQLNNRRNLE